jgi:hypothetical protein
MDRSDSMKSFTIKASDIARCPDHNMSVEHWSEDGKCAHEWEEKKGQLRVWWMPQIPMSPFYVYVQSLRQGKWLMKVLASYDRFQYEEHVKPNYSNVGGIQIFAFGEWEDAEEE